MDIIDYLASDNYIIVNKSLIKIFGLEEAVLLGELSREYRYWKKENRLENDMFYSTIDNIEENTGLTAHEQRQAIKSLENAGVLTTELKGIPAKKYFKLDISTVVKILTTCNADFSQQDIKNLHSSNNKNNNKNNKTISKDIVVKKPSLWDKCINLVYEFTDDEVLQEGLIEFLLRCLDNSKESGKPFYTNTFKGKLNILKGLAEDHGYLDVKTAISIVKQTLDNGWNGFYALKNDNHRKRDMFSQQGIVKSEAYTDAEIAEMNRQDEERKKKGMRVEF